MLWENFHKNLKIKLFLFWDIERTFFGFLTKSFWQGHQNYFFCVHRQIFKKIIYSFKKNPFLGKLSKNISTYSPKLFWSVCQNCFLSVEKKNLQKKQTSWEKKFLSFSDIGLKFINFLANYIRRGSQISIICVQTKKLDSQNTSQKIVKKCFFQHFETLSEKIQLVMKI